MFAGVQENLAQKFGVNDPREPGAQKPPEPGQRIEPPKPVGVEAPQGVEPGPGQLEGVGVLDQGGGWIPGSIGPDKSFDAPGQIPGLDRPPDILVDVIGAETIVEVRQTNFREVGIEPGGVPIVVEIPGERAGLQKSGLKKAIS